MMIKLRFRNRTKNKILPAVSLIVFITIVIASSGAIESMASISTPKAGITLNILTRHEITIRNKFKTEFLASDLAKDAGVTNVELWGIQEANWITQAKTGTYDIGWGGGPILFDGLIEAGVADKINDTDLLAEVNQIPESVAGAPMRRYDGSGNLMWVGAALSTFGFTVNTKVLSDKKADAPSTWTEIGRPEYFLQAAPLVAMGNAPGTTSNTRIYEIIIQKFGWDLGWSVLTSMAANSVIKPGSVATLDAVTQGEVGIAMTIDFYGYGAQLSNENCEYIIPEEQSIVNADPICLLKGDAAKRDAANAFVQFILSKEGQSHWLDSAINRMPTRGDAFDTTIGQSRPDLLDAYNITIHNKGIDFNDTEADSYHGVLLYYFEAAFTDAHAELVSAWSTIVNAWKNSGTSNTPRIQDYNISSWIQALGAPLISYEDAKSISDNVRTDSSFRATKKAEWTAAAKSKYAKVKTAAESAAEPEDVTNPIISNVLVTESGNVSATIEWETDEVTTTRVDYGLTTSLGQIESNEKKVIDHKELPVTKHKVILKNLVPGGKYYFKVTSKDLSGNSATDDNSGDLYTFTLIDTAPPKITNVLSSVSDDEAVVSWVTDEFSDSRVNYGATTSLGSTQYEATETLIHEIKLTGLTPESQYYFEINSSDGVFFTVDDNQTNLYSFTTLSSAAVTPPGISDVNVTVIDETEVSIKITTDKPTRVTLYYGVDTPTSTMTSTALALTHTFQLTDLTSGTEYVFYLNATDAFDNWARYPEGSDYSTFTTLKTETSETSRRGGIPGFEFLYALVALPIFLSWTRRRRKSR
ncbi:MAG: extracellular solute-binding protein [Promethearchaeota archaeon]